MTTNMSTNVCRVHRAHCDTNGSINRMRRGCYQGEIWPVSVQEEQRTSSAQRRAVRPTRPPMR